MGYRSSDSKLNGRTMAKLYSTPMATMCVFVCRSLLGIITKKDVLRHIAELEHKDPKTIRFH